MAVEEVAGRTAVTAELVRIAINDPKIKHYSNRQCIL